MFCEDQEGSGSAMVTNHIGRFSLWVRLQHGHSTRPNQADMCRQGMSCANTYAKASWHSATVESLFFTGRCPHMSTTPYQQNRMRNACCVGGFCFHSPEWPSTTGMTCCSVSSCRAALSCGFVKGSLLGPSLLGPTCMEPTFALSSDCS